MLGIEPPSILVIVITATELKKPNILKKAFYRNTSVISRGISTDLLVKERRLCPYKEIFCLS